MPTYGKPWVRRPYPGPVNTPPPYSPASDWPSLLGPSVGGCTSTSCSACPSPSPTVMPSKLPGGDVSVGGGASWLSAANYGLATVDAASVASEQGLIDPAYGNLVISYRLPSGGPLDPTVEFYFNTAYLGNSDEYANGWTSNLNRQAVAAGGDVKIISGSGTEYAYTSRRWW